MSRRKRRYTRRSTTSPWLPFLLIALLMIAVVSMATTVDFDFISDGGSGDGDNDVNEGTGNGTGDDTGEDPTDCTHATTKDSVVNNDNPATHTLTKTCVLCEQVLETSRVSHTFTNALCSACGYACQHPADYVNKTYESLNSSQHTVKETCRICTFVKTSTANHQLSSTTGACSDCGYGCDHSFGSNDTCTICKYKCTHVWSSGTCRVCAKVCTHSFSQGQSKCGTCGYLCPHSWSNGTCATCGITCSHIWNSAGTACVTCGQQKTSGGGTTEHTCTYDGSINCTICGVACLHPVGSYTVDHYKQHDDDGHQICCECAVCGEDFEQYEAHATSGCGTSCVCGYTAPDHNTLPHEDGGSFCTICGERWTDCLHDWSEGTCTKCGEVCSSHVDGEVRYESISDEEHQAIITCAICGAEYTYTFYHVISTETGSCQCGYTGGGTTEHTCTYNGSVNCTICGKACGHPAGSFTVDGYKQHDDDGHQTLYECAVCGEDFEQYEAHATSGCGTSCVCGYTAPDHNTLPHEDGGSFCTICGKRWETN